MTPDERKGRTIVLTSAIVSLVISATVIVTYVAVKGPERLPTQGIRFLLTVGLMWWLYRGSAVAKWIIIVLFGLTGLYGLLTLLSGNRLAATVGVKIGTLYLSLIGPLLKSSAVDAFLQYQRVGGHSADDSADAAVSRK